MSFLSLFFSLNSFWSYINVPTHHFIISVSADLEFVFFLCISQFSLRFCHIYMTYDYHIDSWLCFHTTVIIFSYIPTFKNKYLTLIWLLKYLRLFLHFIPYFLILLFIHFFFSVFHTCRKAFSIKLIRKLFLLACVLVFNF